MNRIIIVVVSAIIGVAVAANGDFFTGVLIGVTGFLLYEIGSLSRRLSRLERDRAADVPVSEPEPVERDRVADAPEPQPVAREAVDVVPLLTDRPTRTDDELFGTDDTPDDATLQPHGYRLRPASMSADGPTLSPVSASDWRSAPDPIAEKIKDWFTTGNVPVKVGVIVSFFGVAFLLKYAVDRNLLDVPMWLRLVFAALFGVVLLIIGWRLRTRMRVYALSLQGGGVGIVYMTVFAAFRLYGLLPTTPAFVLLVLITAPAAILAVVQDARAMAVLAIAGGFLAPILTSTGQGSHVALFSYYLLLNVAIVGIAFFKSWRELNLLGFLFTFVIGTMWGYKYYRPEYLASTEPFLIAHFLLYQAAAILYAFGRTLRIRGIVDGTLIFGTPIVAFGLQAALLDHTENGLTYSAVALALFYAGTAWWLHGRDKEMHLLRDACIALGVAFATVAVPLAFEASWTAATWAMEGAALIWLSVRQSNLLSRYAGVLLIALAGGSYGIGGWDNDAGVPVLNANVLGGALISLAGFFSARNLGQIAHRLGQLTSVVMFVWGLAWWLGTGLAEIDDRVRHSLEYPVLLLFLVGSGIALSFVGRRLDWQLARFGSLVLLPALALALLGRGVAGGHPFESHAALPWLLAAAAHLYIVKPIDTNVRMLWHVAGVMLAAWLLASEIDWWIVTETWSNAAISLMLGLLVVPCLWGRAVFTWPLQTERISYVTAAGILTGINLLFITAFSVASPGDPLPLPYLPLLNPYTGVAVAAVVLAFFWLSQASDEYGYDSQQQWMLHWILAGVVFVLSTIAVVRGVHFFADVPWRHHALTRSVEVQAALSIYWGLCGFCAMVLGNRRSLRWLWLAGTGLMALVVIKLFIVDLGNSGTVARIVSFIGVGVLLLVVGYIAPVPPRDSAAALRGDK